MSHRYCGDCGAPVIRPEGRTVAICPECGESVGLRPTATAAGLLTVQGESGVQVLLVRLRPDATFGAGRYRLPTRQVDWGEDPRDAVAQAFWDQTGLKVDVSSA